MFRLSKQNLAIPQAEHARLAGTLALHWGNSDFSRPKLPFHELVLGVVSHDRGYPPFDEDVIGETPTSRWVELQRKSAFNDSGNEIVDILVKLHIRRLLQRAEAGKSPEGRRLLGDIDAAVDDLIRTSEIAEKEFRRADHITELCDNIAFDFCFFEEQSSTTSLSPEGRSRVEIAHRVDREGTITVSPWPFSTNTFRGLIVGYRSDDYPQRLVPKLIEFEVLAGSISPVFE